MINDSEVRYLKSFIIYTLSALIIGIVGGAIQGGVLGGIMGVAGVDVHTIQITCGLTGFIFGTFISFFVFRWVIRTQIIPQLVASAPPPIPNITPLSHD
jgi:ABC-type uncharacterized transport system permease subunit